jgi:ABC-type nickel/cobalt efflux system permease component RcnA
MPKILFPEMVSFLSIIALGFFLGMRHATDPDHVIAVTTIVARERQISKSAWIGAFWGIGHTLTIFVVGAGIILFDLVIPPRLGLSMELAVGVMLVILGVVNVVAFFRAVPIGVEVPSVHSHPHGHGDYIHSHSHSHSPEHHTHSEEQTPLARLDRLLLHFKAYRLIRPLVIGLVHGLAGSAAVALLVLATIRNPSWALFYLLVFGIGTIAGMMVITVSIASTFHLVRGGPRFTRRLALASGLLSLGFGLFVAYQICVVNGLLSGHPHWTPR